MILSSLILLFTMGHKHIMLSSVAIRRVNTNVGALNARGRMMSWSMIDIGVDNDSLGHHHNNGRVSVGVNRTSAFGMHQNSTQHVTIIDETTMTVCVLYVLESCLMVQQLGCLSIYVSCISQRLY